jgi:hypothetical protein
LKCRIAANSISFVTYTIPKYPKRPEQKVVATETMVVRGVRVMHVFPDNIKNMRSLAIYSTKPSGALLDGQVTRRGTSR